MHSVYKPAGRAPPLPSSSSVDARLGAYSYTWEGFLPSVPIEKTGLGTGTRDSSPGSAPAV